MEGKKLKFMNLIDYTALRDHFRQIDSRVTLYNINSLWKMIRFSSTELAEDDESFSHFIKPLNFEQKNYIRIVIRGLEENEADFLFKTTRIFIAGMKGEMTEKAIFDYFS